MRVQGEGPIPSSLLFCGEGPGLIESKFGRPFVETAPAGAELTRYLNGYSLPLRADCYITNLVKEWAKGAPTKGKGVTPEDIARDEWELKLELATCQPRIVGALGLYAARWFLGPSITMDASHGLLFHVRFCPDCGARWSILQASLPCQNPQSAPDPQSFWVVPIYHPAAGLHQPELAARTAYDMAQLSAILKLPPSEWNSRCWQPSPSGVYREYNLYDLDPVMPEQAVDTEGTPEQPWGLSLSTIPGKAMVKRVQASYPHNGDADEDPILGPGQLPGTTWILHNYLWDHHVLKGMGVEEIPEDAFHDTLCMAYLLGVEPQGLKELAFRHLGRVRDSYEDVVGEWQVQYGKTGKPKKKKKRVLKSLDDIPLEKAIQYAGADADDTLSVKPILWKRVQDLGLEGVYEIDRKVLPLYARMEEIGLPVDLDYYREFREEIEAEILISSLSLQEDYPGLNPDSPDQVAALLFDHLKLPGGKKTPTGKRYSTEDKYLETLTGWHPVVARIQEHRELQKTKTFIDDVFQFSRPNAEGDTRLYFRLLPTRVVSGRVAYKDPNVGAFPKRSEQGKRFRRGVRARPGRLLGSWDFSQIEVRVLALDSAPSHLQELIASGVDLHERTAERIFGVPPEAQDQCLHRIPAKCFHPDTEVLTKTGWKRIPDLSDQEEVVQAFPSDECEVRLGWTVPSERFTQIHPSGQLIHLCNEGMNLRVTPDHRMLGWNPLSHQWTVKGPEALARNGDDWLNAGILRGRGSPKGNHKLLRLAVALQADGSISEWKSIRWGFTKPRKIERLTFLLEQAKVPYAKFQTKNGESGPVTTFSVHKKAARHILRLLDSDKTLPWRWLHLRVTERDAILDEARYWDSHVRPGGRSYEYSTAQRKNADVLQAIAAVTGLKSALSERVAGQWGLSVKDHALSHGGGLSVRVVPHTAPVACLAVPSSFVLVRDRGIPVICGQTTNFSIIMGTTKVGLAEQQRKNGYPFLELAYDHFPSLKAKREAEEEVCDHWIRSVIDDWGIAGYIHERHAEARRYGCVRDRWGRIRWLPSVLSPNRKIREEAQRQAQAFPPQAGARGFVKHWESEVWRTVIRPLRAEGWYVEPLLDLHDDLVLEFDEVLGGLLKPLVESVAVNLFGEESVPIVCKGSVGGIWGNL